MKNIQLKPLNKDEMILIGDSPSRHDHDNYRYHDGYGGGYYDGGHYRAPEKTSLIIKTVSSSNSFSWKLLKHKWKLTTIQNGGAFELVQGDEGTTCSAARM